MVPKAKEATQNFNPTCWLVLTFGWPQTHMANHTQIIGENGSWYCLYMPPIIYVNIECWWCQFNSSSIWLAAWRCLLGKCMHIEKQSWEIIILLRRCVKSLFLPPTPHPPGMQGGETKGLLDLCQWHVYVVRSLHFIFIIVTESIIFF